MNGRPGWLQKASHRSIWASGGIALVVLCWLLWPIRLTEDPLSLMLTDKDEHLLDARIALDGQWRFEGTDLIPEKFELALLTYEDRWYYWHPGFNPVSMVNALVTNIRSGHIRRGGSTITMQLVRLSRKGKARTYREKWIEMTTAIRLTCQQSKTAILRKYIQAAPFGGNVVGLEAAAWRYYGKPPSLLSWGEAATLAVLPNSPALIHPGRNRQALQQKRDALLRRMVEAGHLSAESAERAREEVIPTVAMSLPQRAPELATTLGKRSTGRIRTTLDGSLQDAARAVMLRHHDRLAGNSIENQAVIIVDNRTLQVMVYAGNSPAAGVRGGDVDILQAPRSPGSTLKPLLYACALDAGLIWPGSLLPDIPTQYGSYRPENYNRQFQGIIPSMEAIAASLNVPMVRLLKEFGIDPFLRKLQSFGLNTLNRSADHYGLSLILGGGEVRLFDLAQIYAAIAHQLGTSVDRAEGQPGYLLSAWDIPPEGIPKDLPSPGSCWQMMEAMRLPDRPEGQENWTYFESSRIIAWKTGTSFGFKDAWAIGVTPEYTVGVWVGNADGEPRPELIGLKAAAPLMFDLFELLPQTSWFSTPLDELEYQSSCSFSGFPAGPFCPNDTILVPYRTLRPPVCGFHQEIFLDPSSGLRMNSTCGIPELAVRKTIVILPPLEEYYYRLRHPEFVSIPALAPHCTERQDLNPIQWIYPAEFTRVILPTDLNGKRQSLLLRATHRDADAVLYWHLDDIFLGQTRQDHSWTIQPEAGLHLLTLVDVAGNRASQQLRVQD